MLHVRKWVHCGHQYACDSEPPTRESISWFGIRPWLSVLPTGSQLIVTRFFRV
jgi:hypothetical protein